LAFSFSAKHARQEEHPFPIESGRHPILATKSKITPSGQIQLHQILPLPKSERTSIAAKKIMPGTKRTKTRPKIPQG
jgi:hypothetical protein